MHLAHLVKQVGLDCFHDQDATHSLAKQVRDHLWFNKFLINIYQKPCEILPNFCQFFNQNLIQQLIQEYIQQI